MTTTEILTGIKNWVVGKLTLKQDVINDLASIRSGAQAGSTSVQPADILSYFDNAAYDSGTHRINFYHGQSVIAYIDASPFIVDGMVDDVRIENGYLVIDFNTASGKQDISIPLTDIFDPSNYYNKTQTDTLLGNKVDKVTGKGLSTNDYTNAEKEKLSGLQNYDDTQVRQLIGQKQDIIQDLEDIRSGASAGATAVQPSTLNSALSDTVAESGVYDVTANNNNAKFASLSALLNSENLDTLIPSAKRKGGMSIKFVQSSDNKYVQYRFLLSGTFTAAQFANTANWLKETSAEELNLLGKKEELISSKIIESYPVVAGGSNSKTINGSFPSGVYGITVRNVNTGNSGNYTLYITPSSALLGYNASCTIDIERTIYFQTDVTAITIGDINPSITESGSMEIAIRRLDGNSSVIVRRDNIEENYSNRLFGDFINGSLTDGEYSKYQAANRIVSISMLRYERDIVLTPKNGVVFGIQTFDDNGNFLSDSGWVSNSLPIYKNTNFKIVINNGSSPLSVEHALDSIDVSPNTSDTMFRFSVSGTGVTGIITDFPIGSRRAYKFSIPEPWDIENVGSGGNNVICVGYKVGSVRTDLFQRSKTNLLSEGWPTEFFIEFPDIDIDGFYIFLRADSGKTASVLYGEYNYGEINVKTSYQGQRINLDSKYALSVIGRMNDYGTPSAQINAQGMAVYDSRYIIQGSNKVGVGSHFVIIDKQDRTLNTITYETLSSGQGFHMNNINLGEKYTPDDILPIAYVSECYNSKSCKVVRFANTFDSFTVLQTITYSGQTIHINNYLDWILDYENKKIYTFNDRDNGLDLYGFNLPTLSNSEVTLTDEDIIEIIRIPNISGKTLLTQGGTIINGKLWAAFGSDTVKYPGMLIISDLQKQEMVSFVDLTGLGECESISLYKKGVLLCCASGGLNSAALSNPAYVYMIFNV